MILRYPSYYDRFACIADRCEDTCCAGWEIDIDDESYEYYMSVPGKFGERIRNSIKDYESGEEDAYESHGFILKENRTCPFLNKNGLCDMYCELGEDALCSVCTYTPRNILEYGGERELALSASCPEAGRLIYGMTEPVSFVEREIEGELDFDENEEEVDFSHKIRDARNIAIRILQNRKYDIRERTAVFLRYAKAVQNLLNNNDPDAIRQIRMTWDEKLSGESDEGVNYELFLKRMRTFTELESIRDDWQDMMVLLQSRYVTPDDGANRYHMDMEAWQQYVLAVGKEYEYEHLIVYYAFMCLARCVDDYDFLGKAKLCVASFLMIRDMDMARYHTNGCYTMGDRLEITRIYAKEVEHSEENLDFLAEEFLFEDAYTPENLLRSLTP